MAKQDTSPIPGPDSESRIVHYAFAYQMLPMLIFSKHCEAVWQQMRDPETRRETLNDAWARTCRHFDVKDFQPVGLEGDFIETERKEYLVVDMPPPVKSPEAYRCVVEKDLPARMFRYFSAEYGSTAEAQKQVVLGEWLAPMNRRNLGYVRTENADDILVAIAALAASSPS
ncbi:MAG: hypothetical protein AAGN35_15140 [Bacteroidota bacterium]